MSASTVSITANPASTRRRPVVVGDTKKSGIDLLGADGAVAAATTTGPDGNGIDLSHSIRGESVLERSRDVVQIRKPLPPSSTTLPSRRKTQKGGSKPEKPRWQTVLSVFTKNLLLLLVLLGLVQMIRRLVPNNQNQNSITSPVTSYTEFEHRIAELEDFLKTTTKMMQVQVEVVDRKIENEIKGLKNELNHKIEDKRIEFTNELNKLEGRTESLEKSLRVMEWLPKEEFDRFVEEFNKGIGRGYGDNVDLDEIRAFARGIVEREIQKHASDGLGMVDYALASGGATVTKHSEPYIAARGSRLLYTYNRIRGRSDAEKMLRPSFGEPGQCFSLKGSSGFVQIKLTTAIMPEAITLEHVAKDCDFSRTSVAYDRSSAPKDCRVSGWLQGHGTTYQVVDTEKMFLLTEFTYDLEKSNVQTFNVLDTAGSGVVDMIRLDFTSNHGNPSYTCIYRLRVHGNEPNPVSVLATQS